jgi:hypothetical protein
MDATGPLDGGGRCTNTIAIAIARALASREPERAASQLEPA